MSTLKKALRKVKEVTIGLEIAQYDSIKPFFKGKNGIEIGGPSRVFHKNHLLPVYRDARQVDGVNFSDFTVWENSIQEGRTYRYYSSQIGYQYIREASDLHGIADCSYDFLISSHCLEHCANPLKTLKEWTRVVAPGGVLLILLPDKRGTFDHRRPTTSFSHLLADMENGTDESDLTHLDEILSLHDLGRDAGIKDPDLFRERSHKNLENRCLHHHVFDESLLTRSLEFTGLSVLFSTFQLPFHLISAVRKPPIDKD
ncbi:MAG: methyltransferase domain-containing protein [Siphonobacter aquaeclarae]|jgi:SAM-dependent methyltransferase|nr:methyltransferase domain-containing protein [Siphonobacter aquaeclarae]